MWNILEYGLKKPSRKNKWAIWPEETLKCSFSCLVIWIVTARYTFHTEETHPHVLTFNNPTLTKEPLPGLHGLSRTTPSLYSQVSLAFIWWGVSKGFNTPAKVNNTKAQRSRKQVSLAFIWSDVSKRFNTPASVQTKKPRRWRKHENNWIVKSKS